MKNFKKIKVLLLATVLTVTTLTGCSTGGIEFTVTGSDFENYATNNTSFAYYDDTDYYADDSDIEDAYVIENEDGVHVEMYDFSSIDRARSLFVSEAEDLAGVEIDATYYAATGTNSSGITYKISLSKESGTCTVSYNGTYYRVFFCDSTFVYAEADDDLRSDLNSVLTDLGILSAE
jgi:hypothetical protein